MNDEMRRNIPISTVEGMQQHEERPARLETIDQLADLRTGDRVLSFDGQVYRQPLRVTHELGYIEPGSPVRGVRVESPNPSSGIEWVLYPAQMDGRPMEIERH